MCTLVPSRWTSGSRTTLDHVIVIPCGGFETSAQNLNHMTSRRTPCQKTQYIPSSYVSSFVTYHHGTDHPKGENQRQNCSTKPPSLKSNSVAVPLEAIKSPVVESDKPKSVKAQSKNPPSTPEKSSLKPLLQ